MEMKEEQEHENSERWLLTYADMITLLMIFFIIMYSMSQVDKAKFDAVKASMGLAMGTNAIIGSAVGKSLADLNAGNTKETVEMTEMKDRLNKMAKQAGLEGKMQVFMDERGLTIRVEEVMFFHSGSSDLNPDAFQAINLVAQTIKTMHNYIRVEGHTDNMPISTSRFPSNWELSTARATTVAKQMIAGGGMDPHFVSAAGYGEYRPIDSNATPEGRQANRRVDIVIVKTELSKSEPNSAATTNFSP